MRCETCQQSRYSVGDGKLMLGLQLKGNCAVIKGLFAPASGVHTHTHKHTAVPGNRRRVFARLSQRRERWRDFVSRDYTTKPRRCNGGLVSAPRACTRDENNGPGESTWMACAYPHARANIGGQLASRLINLCTPLIFCILMTLVIVAARQPACLPATRAAQPRSETLGALTFLAAYNRFCSRASLAAATAWFRREGPAQKRSGRKKVGPWLLTCWQIAVINCVPNELFIYLMNF